MRSDESWYKDVLSVWHNYIKELRGLRVGIVNFRVHSVQLNR